MFEEFCEKQFSKCHVIRLPALFGLGIKKNYLYDMLNNRLLHTIHMVRIAPTTLPPSVKFPRQVEFSNSLPPSGSNTTGLFVPVVRPALDRL